MLWTVNGSVAMVVSPHTPEVRPSDVLANAVAKQMEKLQILERRQSSERVAFCVPIIICEDVDDDNHSSRSSSTSSSSSESSFVCERVSNNRRFLQVPGIDVGVERRPPY